MLPFILGGVALAVTGYGIGKLLEDDVPCSKGSIGGYSQSDCQHRHPNAKRTAFQPRSQRLANCQCWTGAGQQKYPRFRCGA